MHGPDGKDWPNHTLYHEVEKYKKLVYDHGGNETQPPLFRVTVLFSETNGKTTLNLTMAFPSPQHATECAKFIKQVGGNSTWDRLAEYLDEELAGKKRFVLNRSFDVPVNTMFDMWTDPKHVALWLPPTGFTLEFIRADIRPGGSSFSVMSGGNGMKMYGRASYLEIRKPDLLVYTQQFCDEKENITRHPMAPTWPATLLTNVQFSPEGPDSTRVTISWEPYGPATAEEIETFVKARAGMTQGWTGSLDKLESYLETR
jgi:uncharacterized protein YndB with AHSA1/START domain